MNHYTCQTSTEHPDSQNYQRFSPSQGWSIADSPDWCGLASRYCQTPIAPIPSLFRIPGVEDKEFFIRKCYEDLFQLLSGSYYNLQSMLITGQQGIGKMVALFYVFLRFLSERPTQDIAFVDGKTVYLFIDQEVYQWDITDVPYLPERLDDYSPLMVFVRMDNSSACLPVTLWEGNIVMQATLFGRDNHLWARSLPLITTVPFFNCDEFINAFTCSLSGRNFLKELDQMVRKLPLDNSQDSPTTGTLLHLGDSQNSDVILDVLDNFKEYVAKVAVEGSEQQVIHLELDIEEADESDLSLQGSQSAATPIPAILPYALTEQSHIVGILFSMDERMRVTVLVDNAVEMFGPIPWDVFEAILCPTDTDLGLMWALHDFSAQTLNNVTKILSHSWSSSLLEEIHR
ncbi:hypothetical protein E1B28_002933 [Marasmius oreades]|uniref:Uncharacterized protein n=1 Tax=Marasmius oreades TaxID=181124 RepID=A0A9P7UK19_9AGAR|nr:uncharacterized protein E1B28_002933 [Marasmius oreades]KAG7085370.1 hypothetical protein E1B28_002933 [Marasmius oreades]